MFHGDVSIAEVEMMAEAIQRDSVFRLNECKSVPRKRRGKNPLRRPSTAIISRAAQEAYEARLWSEGTA